MGVPGDDRDDRDGAAETADWSPPSLEGRPADDRFDDTRPIEYLDTDQALIGVSFDDQFRAQEFLTAMTRLASVQSLRLRDAVVVSKDATGDVRVRETIDPQPARTAATGAIWSGLLGLMIGGPVGWLAGIGIGAGAAGNGCLRPSRSLAPAHRSPAGARRRAR
ncbi:MAG: hypothetical protein ACO23O_15395 [Ilumatobacteraceae bacterium]